MDLRRRIALRRGDAAKEMSSRRLLSLTMRRSVLPLLVGSLACSAAVACGETGGSGNPPPPPKVTPKEPVSNTSAAVDAGASAQAKDDLDAGAAEWTGPYAGALFLQTPIMSDMEWPRPPGDEDAKRRAKSDDPRDKVVRLGYMRQGAKVPVLPEAHKKSNCAEGWYELVSGGFVCGRYASIDLNHPRFKIAPHLPDMTGALPYQYGYNVANGTPLYRHIPSREERLQLEPWLNKKKPAPKRDDDTAAAPAQPQNNGSQTAPFTASTSDDMMDAGVFFATARSGSSDGRDGRMMLEDNPYDAGVAAVPWYLRDYDGGKPQGLTLDDLKGEGPIARRMVKGFYLALDKEVPGGGTRWWKTVGGMLAPYDRIYVQKPVSEYHGVWLSELPSKMGDLPAKGASADGKDDGKPAKWPGLGFILYPRAKKYIVSVDHKHVNPGDSVSRFTPVRLTGDSVVIGGLRYDETEDNWWMRANEGTRTDPGAPPADLAPGEKWIDVNLTTETMVAFEGTTPVYATLVSTGKRNFEDKDKDHPTPPGSFRIREKHIAATMDGDVVSDSPYSIEDVPWIMYFNGSYALHGAFWHGNWGHTQSHGCVNLSPLDAKAMFGWTEPRLPEGWHGVMSTTEHPGTRVVVHGEAR